MSGVDNLRGVDYQVAYSLLVVLTALNGELKQVSSFKFESLTEDEEDMNVFFDDGTCHFIQVKKKNEGYHWTPSELREVFEKFHKKNAVNISTFSFVSNAAGSTDVVDLKNSLSQRKELTDDARNKFKPKEMSTDEFSTLLTKVEILTRFYPSSDDSKPADFLEKEIKDILLKHPFQFEGTPEDLYKKLWKIIFDLSIQSRKIGISEIHTVLRNAGLSIVSEPWLFVPETNKYIEREAETSGLS
jgi:hypothetical protein